MGFQLLSSDKILRLNDFSLLGMVQSEDWSPNFNAEDIFELGRTDKVSSALELETSGSLELGSIGGLPGLLTRMMVARNASGDFLGYVYNSAGAPNGSSVTGAGSKNAYSFTEAELNECVFDLIMHEQSDQVNFDRSLVFPRCFLTQITGRADANGTATETLNWQGDFVIGAVTPYHDVRALAAKYVTDTTAQIMDNDLANWGSTGYVMGYVYANERRLGTTAQSGSPPTTVDLHATSGLVTITSSEGFIFTDSMVIKAIVYKYPSPATTFPVLASSDRYTTAFFVRGYTSNIYIAPVDDQNPTATEKWLRVQNLDYTIDLKVEALRQISFNEVGSSVYARLPTFPLDTTASATVTETDWLDWKAIQDTAKKDFNVSGADIYKAHYSLSPGDLKETFSIVLEYKTKDDALLQTLRLNDVRVDGYGNRTNVGGRGEITWNFAGTSFELDGLNA